MTVLRPGGPAMPKISRNAPCPCGSGKKYKKCCLIKVEQEETQWALRDQAASVAMDWLAEHYGKELDRAIEEDYCEGLSDEQLAQIGDLPHDLMNMFQVNVGEWLLAEGKMLTEEEPVTFMDLILGEGGPLLEASQREYLQMLAAQPMSLYEVVEAKPNEGMELIDKVEPEAEGIWVRERSASKSLQKGDVFAARVMPTDPKVLSGAIYPLQPHEYIRIRRQIHDGPKDAQGHVERDWVSDTLKDSWLMTLVGPPPKLVDFSGQPITLTTVHYRVKDWGRLEEILGGQPDVVGDAESGWSRLEPPAKEGSRSLFSIQRRSKERAELFAMTRERARAGEKWIEGLAGDILQKTVAEISDPAHLWKNRHERKQPRQGGDFIEGLSNEDKDALYMQFHHKMYSNWADEPIPALGNKTPREAIRSKEGKRDVIELLKSYEKGEARQAKMQQRSPVSFEFLWNDLGLEREEFV
jgi:hypothetical protein